MRLLRAAAKQGFTLMELMIVIVIIGILSAVGMVMFGGQAEKAKIAVAKSNFKLVVKKLSLLKLDCDLYGTVDIMNKINDKTVYNIACDKSPINLYLGWFAADLHNLGGMKNPYKPDDFSAVLINHCNNAKQDDTQAEGFIRLSYFGTQVGHSMLPAEQQNSVLVCMCIKMPCSKSSNRLEKRITGLTPGP